MINDSLFQLEQQNDKSTKRKNRNSRKETEINKIPLRNIDNIDSIESFYQMIDSTAKYSVINRAVSISSSRSDVSASAHNRIINIEKSKQAYLLRLNQQYSFAFICLVFFFIGSPLGSIIRKGGYGYSLLVAILFYMVFIISSIVGEKLLKNGSLGGMSGAWLPVYLLIPFSILFTIQALNDVKFDLASKVSYIISKLTSNSKKGNK
jgi:lipopolysaccharide export system permease protein